MIETLREDYLQLARAKGMREDEVRRRHAVPNARLPVVSLSAINFGFVFSGAIANGGVLRQPRIVRAVRGHVVPVPRGRRVISATTARELRTMLEGVLAAGGTASEVESVPRTRGRSPVRFIRVSSATSSTWFMFPKSIITEPSQSSGAVKPSVTLDPPPYGIAA